MSEEQKTSLFKDYIPVAKTLSAHFIGEAPLTILVKREIVEGIIGDLFFYENDEGEEEEPNRSALSVFQQIDGDENHFRVQVKFVTPKDPESLQRRSSRKEVRGRARNVRLSLEGGLEAFL